MARNFFKVWPRLCPKGSSAEVQTSIPLTGTQSKARPGDVFVLADWDTGASIGTVRSLGLVVSVAPDKSEAEVLFRPLTGKLRVNPAGRAKWDGLPEFRFDDKVAVRYDLEGFTRRCFEDRLSGDVSQRAETLRGSVIAPPSAAGPSAVADRLGSSFPSTRTSPEILPEAPQSAGGEPGSRTPLQNRVTPEGEIIANTARGLFMGNRGILHDDHRRLGTARWKHPNWVTCALSFNGRHRDVMSPGQYTELFFLDEAVSLAAGHRPCARCRKEAYDRFHLHWGRSGGEAGSPREIDAALHAERVDPMTRKQRTFEADVADLPNGAFVRHPGQDGPLLVLGGQLFPYEPAGYGAPVRRPASGTVRVLTPKPNVAVLAAGYRPVIHPSAGG